MIAVIDEKWGERPLLVVVPKPPATGENETGFCQEGQKGLAGV